MPLGVGLRPFPAVLDVNRNYVFFLNGKADIHVIKPPNLFSVLSACLSQNKVGIVRSVYLFLGIVHG